MRTSIKQGTTHLSVQLPSEHLPPEQTPDNTILQSSDIEMKTNIQVFVKLPSGKTLQFEVDSPTTSCFDLKRKIQVPTDLLPNQQILSYSKTQLQDEKMLSEYNIQQDSIIYVTVKPPPKDLLDFDRCSRCAFQAVDPCVLPCGHSCCRACILNDATNCPVDMCTFSFNGQPTPFPPNWMASHFCDPKPETTKNCQICSKQATFWCETCFGCSNVFFYCNTCDASEHASRIGANHVRVPIDQMAVDGDAHRRHCIDCEMLICPKCSATHHREHKTKVIDEYRDKKELIAKISVFPDIETAKTREKPILEKLKQKREKDLKTLARRIEYTTQEIKTLDSRIDTINQETERANSASLVLRKSIEDFPSRDLLDPIKMKFVRTRIDETKLIFTARKPTKPKLKSTEYEFNYKFGGTKGHDQLSSCAINGDGNIYLSYADSNLIQVYQPDGLLMRSFYCQNPRSMAFKTDGRLLVAHGQNKLLVFNQFDECESMDTPSSYMNTCHVCVGNGKILIASDDFETLLQRPEQASSGSFTRLQLPIHRSNFTSMAVNGNGNVVVCNSNSYLSIFGDKGNHIKDIHLRVPQFRSTSVVLDGDGKIIITDPENDQIRIFSSKGKFLSEFSVGGTPLFPIIDSQGNILVVMQKQRKIYVFGE